MNLLDKAFLLKKSVPFEDVELELLLSFAETLKEITFHKGEVIFQKGDDAKNMYFIVEGQVSCETLGELQTSAYFGDQEIFSFSVRNQKATALNECRCLSLSKEHLFMMISESPTLAKGFLKQYALKLDNHS